VRCDARTALRLYCDFLPSFAARVDCGRRFIFNVSGVQQLVDEYGDWFTYDKHPRALIFARNHTEVKDLRSMQALMRYNNFKVGVLMQRAA
jgi:hypothetical protein